MDLLSAEERNDLNLKIRLLLKIPKDETHRKPAYFCWHYPCEICLFKGTSRGSSYYCPLGIILDSLNVYPLF